MDPRRHLVLGRADSGMSVHRHGSRLRQQGDIRVAASAESPIESTWLRLATVAAGFDATGFDAAGFDAAAFMVEVKVAS